MRARGLIGAVVALVLSLVLASAGRAAVRVGETFVPNGNCSAGAPITFVSVADPPPPQAQFSVPSSGVLTSWSFQAASTVPTWMRLAVGRNAGTMLTTVGFSNRELIAPNQLNTFPARIPVAAGDRIGFAMQNPTSLFACTRSLAGYRFGIGFGEVPPGQSATYSPVSNSELDLSAQLEPDADADGFGDETQDLCPADGQTQQACRDETAPNASFTKKPKKKTTKRKAKFEFTADEPGATFTCGLDGKPFKACTSPHKVKVKAGRHTLSVLAGDAAGNVDDTPTTFGWTVRRPR